MRYLFFFMIAAALFVGLACTDAAERPKPVANATPAKTADNHSDEHGDDAPRITLAEAKKDFDAGTAVFIDTRGAEQFKQEHVKGAINITAAEIAAKADTLPKGKKVIAYCS